MDSRGQGVDADGAGARPDAFGTTLEPAPFFEPGRTAFFPIPRLGRSRALARVSSRGAHSTDASPYLTVVALSEYGR